jgi:hypothetical protein
LQQATYIRCSGFYAAELSGGSSRGGRIPRVSAAPAIIIGLRHPGGNTESYTPQIRSIWCCQSRPQPNDWDIRAGRRGSPRRPNREIAT